MSRLLHLLLSLLTLTVFVWVIWQGYLFLSRENQNLAEDTRSLVILIGGLMIVCTYMLNLAIRAAGRAAAQRVMNEAKKEIYEQFIGEYLTVLQAGNAAEEVTPFFYKLETTLLLQGNLSVLNTYRGLKNLLREKGIDHASTQQAFRDLVAAMRRDLSYDTGYFTKEAMDKLITKKPE